ncbi:hypothetical protein [Marinobacter sp. ATCH36]|uniref:hypothetical protein n=1 Tax=Marinobacter sp. ATCH36 TaxID=2945106 RepID=UPI00201FFF44|nr:hypothetical protein [Marinobacter sp. ATCH36]MCL7943948.1 hypothetical protein [Marinobacter sp. ATCH36]
MTMIKARLLLVVFGIFLPYLARVPRGAEWLEQYTDAGLAGWVLFSVLNAIAWGAILAISFRYKRLASLIAPCLLGFGYLAWSHGTLDLSTNPNAPIALVIIPVYALVPIGVGGVIGYIIDRMLRRNEAA